MSVTTLLVVTGGAWAITGRAGLERDVAVDASTDPANPADPTRTPSLPADHADPDPEPPAAPVALAEVEAGRRALGADRGSAVVAALEAIVDRAPVVVVADADVIGPARGVAWRVGAPLVPAEVDGLEDLLDRLDTQTVVSVQADPADDRDGSAVDPTGPDVGVREVRMVTVDGTTVDRQSIADLAPAPEPEGATATLLVREGDPARPLLDALAMATGTRILATPGPGVEEPAVVSALRVGADRPWVVAGTSEAWADTDLDVLAWQVEVVRSGQQLPGGGLTMFPGRRLVALYGSPGAASLGVLGEQPIAESIERARQLAGEYDGLVDEPVVPTFEIITTVASGGAEPSGDYSRRVPLEQIEPWVDAAEEAGVYVILDLQPGRTDFLTQAKEVESLLVRPHVGLALDPEWRIGPDQVHLTQIGSVPVDEVQAVADWLAELTRREQLPQKLLLLHQFTMAMLPDRERLQVPAELAVAIQMDGQGGQPAKDETWRAITTLDPPAGVWFGWKNFYDEDTTLRSPADTMAVEPSPVLVSYQ